MLQFFLVQEIRATRGGVERYFLLIEKKGVFLRMRALSHSYEVHRAL